MFTAAEIDTAPARHVTLLSIREDFDDVNAFLFGVLLLKYFGINKYPVHARDKTSSWKEKDPFIALPLSLSAHSCYISFCITGSDVLTFEGGREREEDVGRRVFLMNVSIEWLKLLAHRSDVFGEGRVRCETRDGVCVCHCKGEATAALCIAALPFMA